MRLDARLVLVTDRDLTGARSLAAVVRAAVAGGVTMVQLRDKRASTRELLGAAEALLPITREAGVALVVNDRADVALAAGADGVHVGAEDLPVAAARRLLGPHAIVGATAADAATAARAFADGADYVGCNAVFATPTKTDTGAPLGLTGLRALVAASPGPVVAIGGINAGNAASVLASGVAGIAVVSAIMAAPDPEGAARRLAAIAGRPPGGEP